MDITFRQLTRRDLDEVMKIEEASQPDAWTRKAFWAKLRNPLSRAAMLEADGEPSGFSICMTEGLSCHLLNFAVAPDSRRKGLGTALLKNLEEYARKQTLIEIYFEVRESNLPAQMLYKKLGYEAVEILRGHYGDDDGYLMRKPIFLEE